MSIIILSLEFLKNEEIPEILDVNKKEKRGLPHGILRKTPIHLCSQDAVRLSKYRE